MKNLNQFIIERLKLTKDSKLITYNFFPKDFDELRSLLKQLLKERGKDADLNDIDVSQVTTFYSMKTYDGLFERLDPHNIDISEWDVSKVEDMHNAFYKCSNFNCDLSKWNVRNVENMDYMFSYCTNFNCDLSKWNVSNVESMRMMFNVCEKFIGQGLENWDVSNVKHIEFIFNGCTSLKNKPSWYKK